MVAISVVIPTYNRCSVVGRAIESVRAQCMGDLELIVVDDGSRDGTSDLLAGIDDPRLVVVRQENQGVCVARNVGVAHSTADFVTFLDSDDEAEPTWLRWFVDARSHGYDLAFCGAHFLGPADRRSVVTPTQQGPAFGGVRGLYLAGTFAIDKPTFTEVGGYRAGLRFSENTDLALRVGGLIAARRLRTTCSDQPLVRIHRGDRPSDPVVRYESAMTLLDHDLAHLRRSPATLATYLAIAGVAASRLGRSAEARRLIAKAIAVNPLEPKNYYRLLKVALTRHRTVVDHPPLPRERG